MMRKNIGKCISVMLTAVLAAGIVPASVFAQEDRMSVSADSAVISDAFEEEAQEAPADSEDEATGFSYNISGPRRTGDPMMSSGASVEYDCIYYGSYWQEDTNGDGVADTNDDVTPIKWRVLEFSGSTATLISDKIIDCRQYHSKSEPITWENSDIRKWLNNEFMNTAFDSLEQAALLNTSIVNADNGNRGTEGGNNTTDKIFLMSEADTLRQEWGFDNSLTTMDEARRAKVTPYAKQRGAHELFSGEMEGNGEYWLRSPGYVTYYAQYTEVNGKVIDQGIAVDLMDDFMYGVRPVLRMNLYSPVWEHAGTVCSDKMRYSDELTLGATTGEIQFDLQNGHIETNLFEYSTNRRGINTAAKLKKPEREGFTFKGWLYFYTDSKGEKKEKHVKKITEKFLKKDQTENPALKLYADWRENSYTIVFKTPAAPERGCRIVNKPKKMVRFFRTDTVLPDTCVAENSKTGTMYVVDKWTDNNGHAYDPGLTVSKLAGHRKNKDKIVLTAHWVKK